MKRWKLNLWILWTTQIISLASFGFGLPFIPLYIQELEVLTPEKLKLMATVLAAAPALTMAIMAPIWGHLADKYGRKLMIMRAMTFAIFVIGAMGLVTSISQLLALRILQGLLTGTVTAAITFVSANTPKKNLVFALGVITSSTFIGYSIGPLFGGLFAEYYGYRTSFFLGSALMAFGAFLVFILVKEDKSTLHQKIKNKDQTFINKYRTILIPSIITVLFMLFFLRVARSAFAPYLSLFVQEHFVSMEGVALVTGVASALIGFTTGFSSILVASIASKFNKFTLITSLLTLTFIVSILLIKFDKIYPFIDNSKIGNPIWLFIGIYILFFLVLGGIEPLLTSTSAMNVSSSHRGALFGIQGFVGSLAWFASPAVAGPIAIKFSLQAVLYIIPIAIFLNVILSFVLRSTKPEV